MSKDVFDPRLLGALLHFERDAEGRLETLRFVVKEDPSGRNNVELIRRFCESELAITQSKIGSLKQKSAKLRHIRVAIDAMIEAGGNRHGKESLRAAKRLFETVKNPPPPRAVEIDPERDVITLGEHEVIVLETSPELSTVALENMALEAFQAEGKKRKARAEWLAFSATDRPHHRGLSMWLGLSRNVPRSLFSRLRASLNSAGLPVECEIGRWNRAGMMPFARLSDDGLELLVPAALAGDPTRKRVVERGKTEPFVRGYIMAVTRS